MRPTIDLAKFLSPLMAIGLLGGCSEFMATSPTQPVDGNTFSTPKRQDAELNVELVAPDGDTQSGETVEFALKSDRADADLGSRRVTTDRGGVASVQFRAGETLDTYTVVASHPQATDLELHVDVVAAPKGALTVTVSDAGLDPVSLERTRVRMFPADDLSCDAFSGLDELEGATFDRRIPSTSDRASFEDLAPESSWTAVAHGYGASGKALAAGCKGGISVTPGESRDVTVPTELLRLDPEGRYDVTSHWDLGSTVAVDVSGEDMIGQIVGIVTEPASGIFGKIANFIEDKTNSLVASVVERSETARKIKNAIDRRLSNGVVGNLRATGRGLKEAMNNLEIHSELRVGPVDTDGSLSGTHVWKTAYVYHRADCDQNAPPSCGRRKIQLQSDRSDGLRDRFDGRVASFDQLHVGEHTIRFDVGHVLVKTLEKLIIPEMTDGAASTLEGAVKHWFDCRGMARDLRQDGTLCVAGQCLSASTVESACTASISWAIDADDFVRNLLNHKATITMAGPGTLSVPNDRGTIETIDEGTFDATVRKVGQSATSSVKTDWSGKQAE
ncbi:MAG: hypothetical protein ABEN55_13825 [Bradymonadaceae bacterium]